MSDKIDSEQVELELKLLELREQRKTLVKTAATGKTADLGWIFLLIPCLLIGMDVALYGWKEVFGKHGATWLIAISLLYSFGQQQLNSRIKALLELHELDQQLLHLSNIKETAFLETKSKDSKP